MKRLITFLGVFCIAIGWGFAQSLIDASGWKPSGTVRAVASDEHYIYFGGDFARMCKEGTSGTVNKGVGLPLTGTATPITGFPTVNGAIKVAISDGAGGFYIGGSFTEVGGLARPRVARIKADKTVDAWTINVSDGEVLALALSGTDLFIAGSFTTVSGQTRNKIAKVTTSASPTLDATWNPNAGSATTNYVGELAISGTNLFVAGNFTNIGGQARNSIASLPLTGTGSANTWVCAPVGGGLAVHAMTLGAGTDLFIAYGVIFQKVSTTTGTADGTWNPNPLNGTVSKVFFSGTDLFVAGSFTFIGGQSRARIAKLSTTGTGTADVNWNPSFGGNVGRFAISGNDLYVAGTFTSIAGLPRNNIAKLSAINGAGDGSWNPDVVGGSVLALAVSGSTLYAGGDFQAMGGMNIRNLARLYKGSMELDTNWQPNPNGAVNCMALWDNGVYVGGEFTSILSTTRNRIARLSDLPTNQGGGVGTWNPNANGIVRAIAMTSTGEAFVGGEFTNIGGVNQARLAKLTATGVATGTWTTSANNTVRSIALDAVANVIYVGGDFTQINTTNRTRLAQISTTNGSVGTWSANTDNSVYALALYGSNLYVGGSFANINTTAKAKLARLATSNGTLDAAWTPAPDGDVYALAVAGTEIIAGGAFENIGGASKKRLARLSTGASATNSTTWSNEVGNTVWSVSNGAGELLVGGEFYTVSGTRSTKLAIFSNCSATITSFNGLPNAVIGVAYSQTLTQTGLTGTLTWSVLQGYLPNGLSLNASTGVISGTPSLNGTFYFWVAVTNGSCTAAKEINVVTACPTFSLVPTATTLPDGFLGVNYSQTISVSPTIPVSWSVTSGVMPNGLTLNPSTGVISGVPTLGAGFSFTVEAAYGNCTQSKTYIINVYACPTASISPTTLPHPTIGVNYSQTLAQTGFSGTVTWSISAGNLPTGFSLNSSTGVISGISNTLGMHSFTVKVTNAGGCAVTQAYTLQVSCPTVTISPAGTSLPNGTINVVYPTQTLTQTGLTGTVTWSITSGSLPAGLSLNGSTGVISGTPTVTSTGNVTFQATNGTCSQSKNYTLIISTCPSTTISPASFPDGTVNSAYTSQTLTQTGLAGTITWSIASGSLPTGLSLNSSSGVVSGTPTVSGSFTVSFLASNGTCSQSKGYTFTINKIAQTITFNALPAKAFGDTPFAISASASSGLTVSFASSNTSVATVSGNTITIVGVGTTNITASQAGNSAYNPATDVTQALTVGKGNQAITFNALPAKTVGDAPFTISATASSNLAVSFASSNTSVATVSGNTITIVGVGTTSITASQAGNANYNPASSVSQNLVVSKKAQTITFNALPTKNFGDAPFTISATASSNLAVSFASSNTSVATVSGNTITIVGAGTTSITASQGGDAIYNPAPDVTQTLTVGKINQTITFPAIADKVYGEAPFALNATSSSGLTVTYSLTTNPATGVATLSGNTITIVGLGSVSVTASQAGNANYNLATDVVRTFNIVYPTSLPTNVQIAEILVYPNPSKSGIYEVRGLQSVDKMQVSYTVSDASGKVIRQGIWAGKDIETLHLSSAVNGTYTLSLRGSKNQVSKKIIKL